MQFEPLVLTLSGRYSPALAVHQDYTVVFAGHAVLIAAKEKHWMYACSEHGGVMYCRGCGCQGGMAGGGALPEEQGHTAHSPSGPVADGECGALAR